MANVSPQFLPRAFLSAILYHLATIYLLTYANIVEFILPTLLFGSASSLSPTLLRHNPSILPHARLTLTLSNIPKGLLWIWANTIIFDLCNQRHPASIREDIINKPYRPIPSGRLTADQTRRWALYLLPCITTLSSCLGASRETPGMYLLLWMYNELGGDKEHWVIRNLQIAVGSVWCAVGMLSVMEKGEESPGGGLSIVGWIWCGIICAVIATTIHIQDLRDQHGDKLVGRKTMPLVYGDAAARWSLIGAMIVWMAVCCRFWSVGPKILLAELLITGWIVWRLLLLRSVEADTKTYKLWGVWLSLLYILPLCHRSSVLMQLWSDDLRHLGD